MIQGIKIVLFIVFDFYADKAGERFIIETSLERFHKCAGSNGKEGRYIFKHAVQENEAEEI